MGFTGSQWVSEPRVSYNALTGPYKELAPRKAQSFVPWVSVHNVWVMKGPPSQGGSED